MLRKIINRYLNILLKKIIVNIQSTQYVIKKHIHTIFKDTVY